MSWPFTCTSRAWPVAGLIGLALTALAIRADGQGLESVLMPGRLIQGHAKVESECTRCHVRFQRAAQPGLCQQCHKEVAADVRARTRYHGHLRSTECRTCHTEHKGRDARIVVLDEATFDHSLADFALLGKHAATPCQRCHRPGTKHRTAPTTCAGCHGKDDRHRGHLGPQCERCHAPAGWKETRFDHGRTPFPLLHKHAAVRCAGCHAEERYAGTPRTCGACHRSHDPHRGVLGPRCEGCHTEADWKAPSFLHDRDTRFVLRDTHRTTRCERCHPAPIQRDRTPTHCHGCHHKDDVHRGALGAACERCHTEKGWKGTRFEHDRDARFPLRGRHREVRCADCHRGPGFRDKAPSTCHGCHERDDRDRAHRGRFGEACGRCHGEQGWKVLVFDHDRDTIFALRGRHRPARCDACHRGQLYRDKVEARCAGCHQAEDRHQGQLGPRCESCHDERSWRGARFDHARAALPLLGRHGPLACGQCHATPRFRDARTECVACHAAADRHQAQLGPRCESCHDERGWRQTRLDHAGTRFPLLGRHVPVACERCHTSLRFKDARTECVACHAAADRHRERLGPRCETCHHADDWKRWTFDHDTRTRFPLGRAHARVACLTCHTRPVKDAVELASACLGCHRKDDAHLGSLGPQCERCHVPDTWRRVVRREAPP